jgi:SAM-dependent methyltransferase
MSLKFLITEGNTMDILSHNRAAWDKKVDERDQWTCPVTTEDIERARQGKLDLVLTPTKSVPMSWFPPLDGTRTLCLASGGGQQGPLLAACGAVVTVLDNSPKQLGQDRFVAERDGLTIETVVGDMADLSAFSDDTFDLIVHPVSNCFVPDVRPVWLECCRVLRHGGVLLAGFVNPLRYVFDEEMTDRGKLEVRDAIPYSDLQNPSEAHRRRIFNELRPCEFGHTLADQLDGQLEAGLALTGLFEDRCAEADHDPISRYIDTFIATRAVKP